MHKLKQTPEDFQVFEIPDRTWLKEGNYQVWKLTKKNYNTEDAIQQICKTLNLERKFISYAGTKDKNAITEQYITIKNKPKETIQNLKLKDIHLEFQGCTNQPLSLGNLKGNKFKITIRNLEKNTAEKILELNQKTTQTPKQNKQIPNYFDEQRFQKNNAEIGKLLIKKEYKKTYELLKNDHQYGEKLKEYLKENKNDYINAIRTIPKKILKLYIHSYQSKLWNHTTNIILKTYKKEKIPDTTPLIGFGTETQNEKTKKILNKIMEEEKITERDFIIKEIPELTTEGTTRKTYIDLQDLKINKPKKDEINTQNDKNPLFKITTEFTIGKGSYATIIIKHLILPKKQLNLNTKNLKKQ
ncbi:tRNA pseudouridine(13) synthase TruD [Candidatus Woesearchaeota archaeon]|nr:tRNA pseudouridine(13) synthase TruD [Candidatus Woesearchaeota archaeon]